MSNRDIFEHPGVDGMVILNSKFRKVDLGAGTGSSWREHVKAVMKLRVPLNAGSYVIGCKLPRFSGWKVYHGESKKICK